MIEFRSIEEEISNLPISFRRRSANIPADLRRVWRIAALILCLDFSRGKKCSLNKLRILNWAVRNVTSQEKLIKFFLEKLEPGEVVVRFDPAFPMALRFLIGGNLATLDKGKTISLTADGKAYADRLLASDDCLTREKEFLRIIKPHFTESRLSELLKERKTT